MLWLKSVKFSLLFLILFLSSFSEAKLVEKVLAVVNNSIITMADVELYKKHLRSGELLEEVLSKKQIEKLLKDEKALLDKLIDKKIIEHEVQKKGYAITESQLEKEIRNIYKSYNMTGEQLKQTLKTRGFSFDEYKSFMKGNIERQKLIGQEIASKITITDSDIANYYYSKNNLPSRNVYQYTISQIFWDKSKSGEASVALSSLKNGSVSFDDLVKKTGGSSGKLGKFKKDDFSKEFAIVEGLVPGEFSGVIKSPAGLHILRLDQKELIPNSEIAEKQAELRAELMARLLESRLNSWLTEKRSRSFVRINK